MITIKKPCFDDLPQIKKLFHESITDTFQKEGIALVYAEEMQEQIREKIQKVAVSLQKGIGNYLVAKEGEEVVGIIAYGEVNSTILEYYDVTGETPEVQSVYILPDYQQKGIGTQLFHAILQVLQEEGFKGFCLDSGFHSAQKFWEKRLGKASVMISDLYGLGKHYMIWKREVEKFTKPIHNVCSPPSPHPRDTPSQEQDQPPARSHR